MRCPFFQICFLVIGFGCSVSKTQESPLIKPKIKSVTILTKRYPLWYWEKKADEIESKDTLYMKEYYEYDSLGNLVAEKVREADTRLNLFYENYYNRNGLLASRKRSPVEDFISSSLDTFIYDEKGMLIEEVTLDNAVTRQKISNTDITAKVRRLQNIVQGVTDLITSTNIKMERSPGNLVTTVQQLFSTTNMVN